MNVKWIIFVAAFCIATNTSKANESYSSSDSITVYVFLHESCVISQYYTLPLRKLHNEFASDKIQFIGLFPNFSSKPENIKAFKEKYNIPFALKTDYFKTKTEKFGATVTPEVVVFNETKNKILYKGRIDDAYARIGKKRRFTNTSELKDALNSIVNDEPILIAETNAVGCFINQSKSIIN